MKNLKIINNFIFVIIFIIFVNITKNKYILKKKKIGVIGLEHSQNVGNNLLKFAMFIKLSELGYDPYIVGKQYLNHNISFISKTINIKLINNFSEIKENDFDILMVNSDQTWKKYSSDFYDIALLRFAEKWKTPKFIYGASLGYESWKFNKKEENIAKYLLKKFSGFSVREISSVKLIEKNLGFKTQFVLDPTLLIDKKYYLNLINDYTSEIIYPTNNNSFILTYIISNPNRIRKYLSYIKKKLNIKIINININTKNQVKEFLYGIIHSKAILTDSYHGTLFSIIFNKPFISFTKNGLNESRFNSLDKIFNIRNRIFKFYSFPPISLLNLPLIINDTKLMILKRESINYLKKNLAFNDKFIV